MTKLILTLNDPHDAVALVIQYLCRSFVTTPSLLYSVIGVVFLSRSMRTAAAFRLCWPKTVGSEMRQRTRENVKVHASF